MKKLTFLVAAFALVGATSLSANAQSNSTQQPQTQTNTTQQTQTPAGQGQDANKEQITQEQLPETIKNSLKGEVYKDWTVSEVYKVAAADQAAGKETYEVLFTNAENKRAVARFNADGTPIKSNSGAGASGQTGAGSQTGGTTGQQ